jgi:hypothetical protein
VTENLRISSVGAEIISAPDDNPQNLRVSSAGVELVSAPDENPQNLRVSGLAIEAVTSTPLPPGRPTIEEILIFGNQANIYSSDFFSATPGEVHESSRWQVTLATDPTFASPVIDVTSTDFLSLFLAENLAGQVNHLARVQYIGLFGFEGEFSDAVAFETEAAGPVPDAPTVTVLSTGPDFVFAETSPYSHSTYEIVDIEDLDPDTIFLDPLPDVTYFGGSEWQVTTAADTSFSSPVFNSGPRRPEDGLQYAFTELTPDTSYLIRARHYDGLRNIRGDWSTAVAFATTVVSGVTPDAPVNSSVVCGRRKITINLQPYVHSEGATHARTQWRVAFYETLNDPDSRRGILHRNIPKPASTKLEYVFPQPGILGFQARFEDNFGRWSPYSDVIFCRTVPQPATPEFLSPTEGSIVNSNRTFTWRMDVNKYGSVVFQLQLSSNNGQSWTTLAQNISATSYALNVSQLPNGSYFLRLRACYQSNTDDCGDWAYFPFLVDRTNANAYSIKFADYNEMPDSWEILIEDENVEWTLRKDASGRTLGLGGKASRAARIIQSGMAFKELGQPVEGDFTATFNYSLPSSNFWFWYMIDAQFMAGGTAYRMLGKNTKEDSQFIMQYLQSGSGTPEALSGGYGEFCEEKKCSGLPVLSCDLLLLNMAWARNDVYPFFETHPYFGMLQGNTEGRIGWKRLDRFQGLNRIRRENPVDADFTRGAQLEYRWPTAIDSDSCLRVRPQYTVKTEVRKVAGGTRVRTKFFGPGIDTSPEWHVQYISPTLEEDYECGFCGVSIWNGWAAGKQNNVMFTSFTATNLTYDECDSVLGCRGGWRYTDFEDDRVTPVYGIGDGFGGVIEADYYTSKNCPRPFLKIPSNFSDTDIDFAAGATTIGSISVEILDKRTDPSNQDSGIVTARMNRRQGRRGLLERWRDDIGWVTVFDGIVFDSEMDSGTIVTIRRNLRDPREQERRLQLFGRNETFAIYAAAPNLADVTVGPIEPYGELPDGSYLLDAVLPFPAIGFFRRNLEENGVHSGLLELSVNDELLFASKAYSDGSYWRYYDITIRWRNRGSEDDWTYLRDMPSNTSEDAIRFADLLNPDDWTRFPDLYFGSFDADDIPEDSAIIDFQVLATRVSEDTPFFWDRGSFGDLLLEIYQGEHTIEDPKIRYNLEAVEAWAASTPKARFYLTEAPGAIREWVETHIFAPLGHAPALNNKYEIFPLSGLLPPESEAPLPTLTVDEIYPVGSWRHSADNAVNVVSYTYLREFLEPVDPDRPVAPFYRLRTREVLVQTRNLPGILAVGEKQWSYSPTTLRAVGGLGGISLLGSVQDETANEIARQVSQSITDRYYEGVQEVEVRTRAVYPDIMDLSVGQWVVVTIPWMPDYETGLRGLSRFMQIKGIRDEELNVRSIRLEDGGAADGQVLLPPCITDIFQTNRNEVVVEIRSPQS